MSVAVWDLPLRLFHWALALCVIGSFVTIKIGGGLMTWHMRFGYTIMALLLFRIIWGFIGGRHARFRDFFPSPVAIGRYLKRAPSLRPILGHNPLGSLSVIAMLVLLLAQATLGLFANDDVFIEAPLAPLVSKDTSDSLTGWHKRGEVVLYALIALHLAAIAYYRFRRGERLVRAMITGRKELPVSAVNDCDGGHDVGRDDGSDGEQLPARGGGPAHAAPAVDSAGLRLRAAITFAVCAGFVYWLVTSF